MNPAIGLLEFDSIARGIEAGDAMAKRSPLEVIRAGTVHPGRYLVLVGGLTADVEEALGAGREVGSGAVSDELFLPDVHPDVVTSVGGVRRTSDDDGGEALGVVETATVAAVIRAADAGVKAARVSIRELRLADDLGGKGYVLFGGEVAEVEAAVEAGQARVAGAGVGHVVIAQLHPEMQENLDADASFAARIAGATKSDGDGGGAPRATRPAPPGDRPRPGTGGTLQRPADAPEPPRRRRRTEKKTTAKRTGTTTSRHTRRKAT
ncbi:MAG TPA: BMC domain-containing protein [Actinomycetota bacterium]|nr:BMC domain-containing protein [Actinomycetota bacterium]